MKKVAAAETNNNFSVANIFICIHKTCFLLSFLVGCMVPFSFICCPFSLSLSVLNATTNECRNEIQSTTLSILSLNLVEEKNNSLLTWTSALKGLFHIFSLCISLYFIFWSLLHFIWRFKSNDTISLSLSLLNLVLYSIIFSSSLFVIIALSPFLPSQFWGANLQQSMHKIQSTYSGFSVMKNSYQKMFFL